MEYLLEVRKINKSFGEHRVLKDVSFAIQPGEIVGLIGRNGMGKTTLMKCILGLNQIDTGEILFREEKDFQRDKAKMDEIGYLLDCKMFENLNAYENIKIQEWYKGNRYHKTEEKKVIENILSMVDLKHDKKKVKQFSFGMKQRLGLALALLGQTKLLILDEPFVGLDPVGISAIRDFIVKTSKEREMSILISSHQLSEIKGMCERYLFLLDGQLSDYRYDSRKKVVLHTKGKLPLSSHLLVTDKEIEQDENKISFWFEENRFNRVIEYLVNNHILIRDIELHKDNLEALFQEEKVCGN